VSIRGFLLFQNQPQRAQKTQKNTKKNPIRVYSCLFVILLCATLRTLREDNKTMFVAFSTFDKPLLFVVEFRKI
jgi:hypothetical protein